MTQDYPDFTRLMQVIGTDIMIPFDIQGANIMLPMDIQGQNIDLRIDIVAQTVGNINVDLVAQTVGNIGIDIKANTLGNLTIDVEAQSVGIYLKADWEVLQGTDKNEFGSEAVAASTSVDVIDYTVNTGKTFYVCQWGFNAYAGAGVIAWLLYKHNDTYTSLASSGGYSGNSQSFTKPIAIVAGDHVILRLIHYHTNSITVTGNIGGYEL